MTIRAAPKDLEMITQHISKRYRINVSTSVKGIKTYECTVDIEGASLEEVVVESDRLVALLDTRYPAQVS